MQAAECLYRRRPKANCRGGGREEEGDGGVRGAQQGNGEDQDKDHKENQVGCKSWGIVCAHFAECFLPSRMFRFDRLFQDLDDLSFKFDLMRKAEEEKAAPSHKEGEDNGKRGSSSFAFDLFMESALYPGREGAAGVYRQMVEAMAGSPKSTRHLYHR